MSLTVQFFPNINLLIANPYWEILRSALRDEDVLVSDKRAMFGYQWLKANRTSVDVLHFHYIQSFYAFQNDYARLRWVARLARNLMLARLLGYRTIFTLHNLSPTYSLKPGWVDYLGHWIATNLTDAVIVHCEYARQMLAKRYGRRNDVHVIAHPHFAGIYDDSISEQAARAQLGLQSNSRVILFFGGIRPNKGVHHLIKVFREMPREDLRLVIAGKPWPPQIYQQEIQRLASSDERIILHAKFIPDDQVQIYFRAANIVVLPFTRILTSGSAMLSMSFGRPVIVPDVGCLAELSDKEVGFTYHSADPSALAQTLRSCWTANLDEMGANAEKYVRQYTWKEFGAITKAVYSAG